MPTRIFRQEVKFSSYVTLHMSQLYPILHMAFHFLFQRCEYLTTVQLAGTKPYIQLDPLFTTEPLNLTMVIKTRESSGVLLYYGDSDHLAVELFHGRVRVCKNFPGSKSRSPLGEPERGQPSRLHHVQLRSAQRRQAARGRAAVGWEEPHHEGGRRHSQEPHQPRVKGILFRSSRSRIICFRICSVWQVQPTWEASRTGCVTFC